MGIPVLILGYSGSGKTRSIKLMDPEKTGVFLVEKPRLPFREQFKVHILLKPGFVNFEHYFASVKEK